MRKMQFGVLAGIAILSEVLPFTPLRGNGIVHLAAHMLNDAGLMNQRQLARLETDEHDAAKKPGDDAVQISIDQRRRVITIKF
jgi:hypothetical protein